MSDARLPAPERFEGIQLVRLPLDDDAVGHVNTYLIEGHDGYILVDCGWDRPIVLDALQAGLRDVGISLGDVTQLVVTHWHADHYGLAGRLVAMRELKLFMHGAEWRHIRRHVADPATRPQQEQTWLARNGLEPTELTIAEVESLQDVFRFSAVAPYRALLDGERLPGSRLDIRVIWTPGHTPGHVCLYDADQRILLSGDHVLDPITPNVSIWGPGQGNPLGDFLASLRKVAQLDVDLVLPAHGDPFAGLDRRVSELLAHHDGREQAVLWALDRAPLTATDVARQVPWTRRQRRFDDLTTIHKQLAVTETIAHLEELRARRVVRRTTNSERITYRLAPVQALQ